MKRLAHITHLLRRLRHEEEGSIFMFIGLGILMLVGATGSAIDMGRAQYVQARMSSALDAAGLAAGAVISTQNAQTTAERYFYANFQQGFMNVNITHLSAVPNADCEARPSMAMAARRGG